MVSIKPFKVSTGQIEFSPGWGGFPALWFIRGPPEGASDCRLREMAEFSDSGWRKWFDYCSRLPLCVYRCSLGCPFGDGVSVGFQWCKRLLVMLCVFFESRPLSGVRYRNVFMIEINSRKKWRRLIFRIIRYHLSFLLMIYFKWIIEIVYTVKPPNHILYLCLIHLIKSKWYVLKFRLDLMKCNWKNIRKMVSCIC